MPTSQNFRRTAKYLLKNIIMYYWYVFSAGKNSGRHRLPLFLFLALCLSGRRVECISCDFFFPSFFLSFLFPRSRAIGYEGSPTISHGEEEEEEFYHRNKNGNASCFPTGYLVVFHIFFPAKVVFYQKKKQKTSQHRSPTSRILLHSLLKCSPPPPSNLPFFYFSLLHAIDVFASLFPIAPPHLMQKNGPRAHTRFPPAQPKNIYEKKRKNREGGLDYYFGLWEAGGLESRFFFWEGRGR